MLSKSIVKKSFVMFAAGVCASFFATALPAYAQMRILGGSPPVTDSAPDTPIAKRLVLHDVRVQGRDFSVAPSSRPVLDYAVQILQQYPETLVYVSGQGDVSNVQREAEAVARYLSQRGIAANRLVLSNPGPSKLAAMHGGSARRTDVIVLNFIGPNCATCS